MISGIIILNSTDPSVSQSFAIVNSGTVTNLILATGTFIETQTNMFDYAVAGFSGTVSIGYTYNSTTNTFSLPIPTIPSLSIAIASNIASFQTALQSFLDSSYSVDTRMNFIGMYINAQLTGLTGRQAYIAQLFPWQNSVIAYAASYIAAVEALTDVSTVLAYTWDFSSLQTSNPNLTTIAAIQIMD
jgi:hypothetical protein